MTINERLVKLQLEIELKLNEIRPSEEGQSIRTEEDEMEDDDFDAPADDDQNTPKALFVDSAGMEKSTSMNTSLTSAPSLGAWNLPEDDISTVIGGFRDDRSFDFFEDYTQQSPVNAFTQSSPPSMSTSFPPSTPCDPLSAAFPNMPPFNYGLFDLDPPISFPQSNPMLVTNPPIPQLTPVSQVCSQVALF